jgi:circadian clock protein KaiB
MRVVETNWFDEIAYLATLRDITERKRAQQAQERLSQQLKEKVSELEALLKDKFSGQYSLEIIDVLVEPELAEVDRILATPTVIKVAPEPEKRIVGSLGDREKVLTGLGLV